MSAEDRKAENAQAIEILSREIQSLDENTYPTAKTVCENELFRLRGGIADTVDVVDNRRVKIRTKVNIPSEQYPSINFVGKLLGPGGSTLRTIQEETRTKMAILGRGSLRDEAKEKELLSGGDPKYQHLKYPLHLQIDALAPPAEAYYNISHALAQVRRIMVPDANGQQPPQQQQQTTSWAAAPPVPPVPARGGGVMRGRGGRGRGGFANQAPFVPIPAGFTSPPPVPMRGRGGAARGRGGWGMNNGAPGNGSGAAPGNGDVYNNGMDQYGSYPDQMGYDQNQYGTSGFEDYSGVYGGKQALVPTARLPVIDVHSCVLHPATESWTPQVHHLGFLRSKKLPDRLCECRFMLVGRSLTFAGRKAQVSVDVTSGCQTLNWL